MFDEPLHFVFLTGMAEPQLSAWQGCHEGCVSVKLRGLALNIETISVEFNHKAETHTELTVPGNTCLALNMKFSHKHAKNSLGQGGWGLQTGSEKGLARGLAFDLGQREPKGNPYG